jgi:hypothetical protein
MVPDLNNNEEHDFGEMPPTSNVKTQRTNSISTDYEKDLNKSCKF